MSEDFKDEDFYHAAGATVTDGYGRKLFDCDSPEEARSLASELNLAYARGVMKGFALLCPAGVFEGAAT